MITTNRGKTEFKVQRVIAARMQTIEQLLDLADLVRETDEFAALLQEQVAQRDIEALKEFVTEYLGYMTEWQVSAFHEQFNVLKARVRA